MYSTAGGEMQSDRAEGGATAMVLAEFLVILGYTPDPWAPDDVDE